MKYKISLDAGNDEFGNLTVEARNIQNAVNNLVGMALAEMNDGNRGELNKFQTFTVTVEKVNGTA